MYSKTIIMLKKFTQNEYNDIYSIFQFVKNIQLY